MRSVFHFKKDILQMEKERWRGQNACLKKEHPGTKIKGEIKVFIYDEKTRINYGPLKMKLLIKRRFNVDISTTAIYKFYKKKNLVFRPQRNWPNTHHSKTI